MNGVAAVWVFNLISDKAERTYHNFMAHGMTREAGEIYEAYAELKEAARQYKEARQDGPTTGDGSAVLPPLPDPRSLNRWLSSTAVADALGVSGRRVRQLVESGELEAKKVSGRWAIEEESLKDLLAMRKAAK